MIREADRVSCSTLIARVRLAFAQVFRWAQEIDTLRSFRQGTRIFNSRLMKFLPIKAQVVFSGAGDQQHVRFGVGAPGRFRTPTKSRKVRTSGTRQEIAEDWTRERGSSSGSYGHLQGPSACRTETGSPQTRQHSQNIQSNQPEDINKGPIDAVAL